MFSQGKTILESTVFDISSQTLSTSGYEFEKNFVVDDKKVYSTTDFICCMVL